MTLLSCYVTGAAVFAWGMHWSGERYPAYEWALGVLLWPVSMLVSIWRRGR